MAIRIVDLIRKKRDGGVHSKEEIDLLVSGYAAGRVPDYQMSAWLMAVLWRGLTDEETFALTGAMTASGEVLDLSHIALPTVDKHSTGGVGDKASLAVVPILASGGVAVAKMSGRGLGNTGGTLDKLESIPGFRTRLTIPEILKQVEEEHACICGQTETLVPADKMMYALRDSSGTVESLPLIASSIMSKKLAGGSQSIVLDVKAGSGAFMKTIDDARALADLMVRIGQAHGRRVVAVLSDMNAPLGYNIGNALEIQEIVRLLQSDPNTDMNLLQLVRYLAAIGFVLAGKATSVPEGEALADAQIQNGAAFEKLRRIVLRQGGDPEYLGRAFPISLEYVAYEVKAANGGYIRAINANAIGLAAMKLGAGRQTKEDKIDPSAGITLHRLVGRQIKKNDTIATLFTAHEAAAHEISLEVRNAFQIGHEAPEKTDFIHGAIGLNV